MSTAKVGYYYRANFDSWTEIYICTNTDQVVCLRLVSKESQVQGSYPSYMLRLTHSNFSRECTLCTKEDLAKYNLPFHQPDGIDKIKENDAWPRKKHRHLARLRSIL